MAPRSTKNLPSTGARRYRKTANVRAIGSFRGALEPGFVERISDHWRFSGARAFKPVRLNFRRPGNPFDLARRPRSRRTPPARYVFSPTIQLTFPFNPITNLFFESDTHSGFQWLLSEMNAPRPSGLTASAGGATASVSHGGRFWTSLRQFRNYREAFSPPQSRGALLLLNEARLAGTPAPAAGPQARGDTYWTLAPLVFTALHTERRQARTLGAGVTHHGASPVPSDSPRSGRHSQTERALFFLRSVFAWGAAARGGPSTHTSLSALHISSKTSGAVYALARGLLSPARSSWAPLKASGVVNAVALRLTFRTQTALLKSGAGPLPTRDSFAKTSLTFAPAKSFNATRRDQSFVPPAPLSYAKRESPQTQAVVEALRELRLAHSEAKPPAAPQPPSVEQLTGQIRLQLERELRIEKERRGR